MRTKKKLFEQVKIGKLELKNRLIRSATWEGLADGNGHMPEKLYQTYERLAKGGIGAIITGFTSVADDDHYFSGMVRLSKGSAAHNESTLRLSVKTAALT